MEKLLFKAAEVCELTGIGKSRVYQLIGAGTIPSVRIGKCLRVPADRLRQWLEGLQVNEGTLHGADPAMPPAEVTHVRRARGTGGAS